VGALIQQTLSDVLRKNVNDPRLDMTIITGVKMAADLKSALIFFSTSTGSNKSKEDAYQGFNSALGYIRRSLAAELKLRYMPHLKFSYDESFDYASHIEGLLKKVREEDSVPGLNP
jgi:ribosome-binding factor A